MFGFVKVQAASALNVAVKLATAPFARIRTPVNVEVVVNGDATVVTAFVGCNPVPLNTKLPNAGGVVYVTVTSAV